MADTVSTVIVTNTPKRLTIKLLGLSDGTGEVNVVKVDKSAYTGLNGLEPSCFRIMRIEYDVAGLDVAISSDHTTDIVLARLGGMSWGCLDYSQSGGLYTSGVGGTGDILFTTTNATSGDSYDVTLYMIKKD